MKIEGPVDEAGRFIESKGVSPSLACSSLAARGRSPRAQPSATGVGADADVIVARVITSLK